MEYIHIRTDELLKERGINKNRICKDLSLRSSGHSERQRLCCSYKIPIKFL